MGVALALVLAAERDTRAASAHPEAVIEAAEPRSLDTWVRLGNAQLFAGDFDGADLVWNELRVRYPGHPAADVLAVDTLFWRQMYDDADTGYDADIERLAERAVELGEAALKRTPDQASMHLYAGKALMQLGRLHGIRGQYYKAGTKGERGRVHLEKALALAPELVDARYQIGLYYYYSRFIPAAVKWLDFLWFVPAGNADEGLAFLNLVAREGDLERDNARFILANIETYHLKNLERAHELIAGLHADYPTNTMIHFELLEVLHLQQRYREMREAALELEANPRTGRLNAGRKTMARVWRARAEIGLGNPQGGIDVLEPLVLDEPDIPSWAKAWIRLTQGHALDALGRRAEALERYAAVQSLEEPFNSRRASSRAQEAIDTPYQPLPARARSTH